MNFLSWIESFNKPRQSRGTYTSLKKPGKRESPFDDTMEAGESRSFSEENDHSNKVSGSDSESVFGVKGTNKNVTIGIKRKLTLIRLKTSCPNKNKTKLKF